MRSTRASAAWAGIALATSFLSVTIIGMQPHTATTRTIAQTVAVSAPVNALGYDNSVKRAKGADDRVESRTAAN